MRFRQNIVLISTHIVSDVEAVASDLVVLKKGRVLFHGAPKALTAGAEGHVWEYTVPDFSRILLCFDFCRLCPVHGALFRGIHGVEPALRDPAAGSVLSRAERPLAPHRGPVFRFFPAAHGRYDSADGGDAVAFPRQKAGWAKGVTGLIPQKQPSSRGTGVFHHIGPYKYKESTRRFDCRVLFNRRIQMCRAGSRVLRDRRAVRICSSGRPRVLRRCTCR